MIVQFKKGAGTGRKFLAAARQFCEEIGKIKLLNEGRMWSNIEECQEKKCPELT